MAGPPEFVAKRIREIGEVFNPDVVSTIYDIYIPLLRAAPTDGVTVKRDIAYGPNKRHLLDIHTPASVGKESAPAVVYLHGGGFVRGHKNAIETEPDLIHGNIATFFARHGIIGINATYRLAPEHTWPSGGEDVSHIISFLQNNADDYGINKDYIFLFGQSAGATHVSTYLFDKKMHREKGAGIAGAILFSGAYDISLMTAGPITEYYGSNEKLYNKMSSINYIDNCEVPLFIVTSEFDPPMFRLQGDTLVKKLKDGGLEPTVKRLANHNHLSQAIHLNTEDDTIGPDLVLFVQKNSK